MRDKPLGQEAVRGLAPHRLAVVFVVVSTDIGEAFGDVGRDDVERLHRLRGLFGEHGRDIGGIVGGIVKRVLAERIDGHANRRRRHADEAQRDAGSVRETTPDAVRTARSTAPDICIL